MRESREYLEGGAMGADGGRGRGQGEAHDSADARAAGGEREGEGERLARCERVGEGSARGREWARRCACEEVCGERRMRGETSEGAAVGRVLLAVEPELSELEVGLEPEPVVLRLLQRRQRRLVERL